MFKFIGHVRCWHLRLSTTLNSRWLGKRRQFFSLQHKSIFHCWFCSKNWNRIFSCSLIKIHHIKTGDSLLQFPSHCNFLKFSHCSTLQHVERFHFLYFIKNSIPSSKNFLSHDAWILLALLSIWYEIEGRRIYEKIWNLHTISI
jgi:hypothetical protein